MEIKLLHMYGDIMNLYGEYANVSFFSRYLEDLGCTVSVDTLSLYDDKDISGYDFYYMGSGTEQNQKIVLTQLLKYKDVIARQSENNKLMLFTGNSFELLGKKITDANGKEYECLGIADFETVETNKRITGDCLAKADYSECYHVGFINKCSRITGVKTPLFKMVMGSGNECEKGYEGFLQNNTFGTHITGPIIVKNPHFMKHLAGIIGAHSDNGTGSINIYNYMEKSYSTTVNELKKRLEINNS